MMLHLTSSFTDYAGYDNMQLNFPSKSDFVVE